MTDFDSIWRTQDEIRTVVNAVLGECIWNLAYEERRSAIVLELTVFLDEDAISNIVQLGHNSVLIMTIFVKNQTFFLLRKKPSLAYYTFAPRIMKHGSLAQLD